MESKERFWTWKRIIEFVSFEAAILILSIALFVYIVIKHLMSEVYNLSFHPYRYPITYLAICFSLFITITNIHLSFLRPLLYKWKHGTMENFKFVSGFPMCGTLALGIAALRLPGNVWIGCILMACFLLDCGGLPWASVCIGYQGIAELVGHSKEVKDKSKKSPDNAGP